MHAKKYKSKPFSEYFLLVNGNEITIDFRGGRLIIWNTSKQAVSTIYFSENIIGEFAQQDLLKANFQTGEISYSVYQDGFEGYNWLWASTVTVI